MTPSQQNRLRKKGRTAGLTIAGTMLLWLGVQWLGPRIGMGVKMALLVDFAALAAFVWALFVTYQIMRASRDE